MNKTQQNIFRILKKHFVYSTALGFTLLFFLYKGFVFLIIGSYIPLILISVIVILFVLCSSHSKKSFKRIINIWAIILIVWSSARLLLSLINQLVKQVPQSHISEQLNIFSGLLSLLFLYFAINLLRFKKRLF